MNHAREQIADLIGAEKTEIYFTSCATESNNMGVMGAALRYRKKGKRVVISELEHISVINISKELTRQGFDVQKAPSGKNGILDLEGYQELVNNETVLVSVMAANNEIGTIQPIKEVAEIAHQHDAIFHTDAVAAVGQIPVNVKKMGIDLMSMSSNDIYGPKGVGAFYLRNGLRTKPHMIGGGQEGGQRSGTENIPGIVGMGKAAELTAKNMDEESKRLTRLRDKLIKSILESIPESYLNGHPTQRVPNNANIRFSYIEGEALILSLDQLGIYLSSGSACVAKTLEPSHVLQALGLKHEDAHGSLVYTLGKDNNDEHVEYVIRNMPDVVKKLRAMSPLTPKELR
jgi:cysteine desulfurase